MQYLDGLVSIIMPVYNAKNLIMGSIESIIEQSYDNWELIIVNDCSNDGTFEILDIIEHPKIKIFHNNSNQGVAKSRNIAILQARGQYVCFLDSDDLWCDNKLELQIEAISKSKEAVCCHTAYIRISMKGEKLSHVKAVPIVNFDLMTKGNFIGNLTGMIDRNKLSINIEQRDVKHEDYLMWLEILKSDLTYYSVGLNQVCAKYRVVDGSVSSNKFNSMIWHWIILRNHLGLNYALSCKNIFYYLYYAIRKRA